MTKSEPAFEPEPPVETVTRLPIPAPDDSMTAMAREIAGLKIRVMHLDAEAARKDGIESELRRQLRHMEDEKDHYHGVAIATQALIDQAKHGFDHIHASVPPLRPIDRGPDGEAEVIAAKFAANAAE